MNTGNLSNDEMLFSINQVAKMLEIVPATIRNWEKSGLFTAKRKDNNYRVFDFDDIELLKKIKRYSIDENTGIFAIKNIMRSDLGKSTPVKSAIDENAKYSKKLLSNKWKESREKLNYTLEDVTNIIGISSSYLSKIENGQANISLDILNKLANFYGESLLFFFDNEITESKVVRNNEGEKIDVGLSGVKMESLISVKQHVLYPMMYTVEPGCGSLESHHHHGEEYIYIINGKVQVTLNETEVYVLRNGDSMYFKSNEYHNWYNISKKTTKLLWVHSPVES